MNLLHFNPTVRETNKYLTIEVEKLLKKHNGVSNEDFERELVQATGIGWKQVKNYKNHPKPSQQLKDNSIVIKYIRECRKRDVSRKVRYYAFIAGIAIIVVSPVYIYTTLPKPVEVFTVHTVQQPIPPNHTKLETKVFLSIRDFVLRLGPIKHSKLSLDQFNCNKLTNENLTNCSFFSTNTLAPFQIVFLMDESIIKKYTILTFDPVEIIQLKKQIANFIKNNLEKPVSKTLLQKKYILNNETIDILENHSGPGSRPMINVSVSFTSGL